MKRLLPFLLSLALAASLCAADQPIDWERAKALYERTQAGEKLTDDEQKYLDEAKRQRAAGGGPGGMNREKMRAIKEKVDRGEKLTDEEQKIVDEFRRRAGGGPEMERVRQLFEKKQRGETLTADEEKMLEAARRRRMGGGPGGENRPPVDPGNGGFDWQKAEAAHAKEQRGESLSDDDKKLLAEARKRFEEGRGPETPPAPAKDPSAK